MKTKQILSAVLVGVLLCSSGCQKAEEPTDETAEEEQSLPQGTAVEIQPVASGEMSAEYSLTGKVVAENEVQVFPLLAGEVTSLPVKEGDYINNGQLLFTVDTDTVTSTMDALQQSYSATKSATDRAIEQAQAGVRSAETGVESANTTVSTASSGIDSAQATVDSAQAAVDSAQATVDSAQASVNSAQAAVDSAQTGVESAQATVESARAGLKSAEASAEAAQAGAEAAEAQLAAAQIGVESAQTALDNATAMYEAGAGAEQDVINAERGLRQAETTLAQAEAAAKQVQAQKQQAEAGLQQAQAAVQQAELGVEQAQSGLTQAQSGLTQAQSGLKQAESGKKQAESGYQQALVGLEQAQASSTQAETGLKQARAAVEQAQAASGQARAQQSASLAQIQANIDQINSQARLGTVYAPCSGIITAVNLTRGSVASSAQPAVVIAENGEVEISVSVAEDVFTNIRAGDNAGVVISVLGDEMIEGTIDTLPAAANVQTNLYDVSVRLPAETKPPIGAFATVTFYTDRRSDTLQIPTEAILTGNNNEQFVFIVEDTDAGETASRVLVETGLVSKTNTEILSGLQEGDRVIVKGQSYLSDGSPVRIVEAYTGSSSTDTDATDSDTTDIATMDTDAAATGTDATDTQTNIGGSAWEAQTSLVVDENGEG